MKPDTGGAPPPFASVSWSHGETKAPPGDM
ncbi:hypothetical protein SAMN05216236_13158 [Sedimentitalea nanhaiensis]|uniref:Uncharacterized protein n=1 Tax=Sedimentitalea nanhaiensis TaxID=999627 RepID=A0A1I7DP29_9RHOB|nr:hypothetical protein SAMN05216236_13158 [Sedimentitalea nanhaiensis]